MWAHARGADVALCTKKCSGPDAGNKVVSYIRTYAHQATEKIELLLHCECVEDVCFEMVIATFWIENISLRFFKTRFITGANSILNFTSCSAFPNKEDY